MHSAGKVKKQTASIFDTILLSFIAKDGRVYLTINAGRRVIYGKIDYA